MELALHNFSSWDDWDDDWGFDNGSDSNSRYGNTPSSPSDDYGTRGTGGRTPVPSHQDREDPDVFIIRSVSENPLTGVSALSKIIRGFRFPLIIRSMFLYSAAVISVMEAELLTVLSSVRLRNNRSDRE